MGHGKNSHSLPWATSAGPALLRLEEETLCRLTLTHKTEELVLALGGCLASICLGSSPNGSFHGSLNGAVWPSSQHSSQVPRDKGESFK